MPKIANLNETLNILSENVGMTISARFLTEEVRFRITRSDNLRVTRGGNIRRTRVGENIRHGIGLKVQQP